MRDGMSFVFVEMTRKRLILGLCAWKCIPLTAYVVCRHRLYEDWPKTGFLQIRYNDGQREDVEDDKSEP